MATDSIFATPVIDTEWGIKAICDAYDEWEAENERSILERERFFREHPEGNPLRPPVDPFIASALARVRAEK